jgi:flagellin
MTISVQSSTAAAIALDALANAQTNATPTPADPAGLLQQGDSTLSDPSSIVDVSGGAAAASLSGLSASLAQAASIADAAATAGGGVVALLQRMRLAAQNAADPSVGADARTALNDSFVAALAKIGQLVGQAQVGGVNLIDGTVKGELSTGDGASGAVSLTGTDLSAAGPLIGLSADANLTDPAAASGIADALGGAIERVRGAVDTISGQGQAIQAHLSVLAQASLALSPGQSGAVDTGINQDGARLQALLVQQQLSQAGASVANQAPQSLLALFR